MVNIFIANLDWSITSEDLKTTFSTFGDVHYAHVVFEKETKRSKGYGYVEMESAEGAIAAIEALNGMEINGRAIDVKIASPKSNRPKKEEKKFEKKPFVKKPFKPGGFNKGGGGNYNRGDRGGDNRSSSPSYSSNNNTDRNNSNNDRNNTDRVMRPRRTNSEGGGAERRYEKVERVTRKPEDNE